MTALHVWGKVPPAVVRVNWGRWIADCPGCGSALHVEHFQQQLGAHVWYDDGDGRAVQGPFLAGCWDCSLQTDLVWPAEGIVRGVERLLGMRPEPRTRNWTVAESLHELALENAAHGIFNHPAVEAATGGPELLVITDGGIVEDRLPATRELTAPPARRRLEA